MLKKICAFLTTGATNYGEETFFKDIFELVPTHNMIFDFNIFTFYKERYWHLPKEESLRISYEDAKKN